MNAGTKREIIDSKQILISTYLLFAFLLIFFIFLPLNKIHKQNREIIKKINVIQKQIEEQKHLINYYSLEWQDINNMTYGNKLTLDSLKVMTCRLHKK